MRSVSPYVLLLASIAFVGCSEPIDPPMPGSPPLRLAQNAATAGPTVTSALPSNAPRDTTLDVQINGTGFSTGAQASLQLNGVIDPRVRVNNTKFVKSTQVTANVTIASDAVVASYDVVVALTSGKKGIGTELFAVLALEQLSSPSGNSAANDVNSTGLVVGGRAGGCDSHQLPAYWLNGGGQPIDLPLLAPWCYGNAMFVNDGGLIIGHMNPGTTNLVGVLWTADGSGGYTVADLGTLEGYGPDLMGLNNAGLIVANIDVFSNATGGGFWRTPQTPWQRLQKVQGATACFADAINENNEIGGFCYLNGISEAAFWASPTATPELLPRFPNYNYAHTVHGLNNTGIAVGYAMNRTKSGQAVTTGVKWVRSGTSWTIYALPDLGGGGSSPSDVNDAGWIVGSSTVSGGKNHAAIWRPDAVVKDLGALGPQSWAFAITPSSATQTVAVGVGDVGSYRRGILYRPR
jgi:probable HAF family extracellular repeat protein